MGPLIRRGPCNPCRFKEYWTYFGAPPAEAPGRVGAIDCTLEKPLCQKMGVNAYPTMKVFKFLG